ncbi:neuropeptides B/W receptor type 1 [Ctenodactylus gundi]
MDHVHGAIYRERGLLTVGGKDIKNRNKILDHLAAIWLPRKVAIIHCLGHQKGEGLEAVGIRGADAAAKEAAQLDSQGLEGWACPQGASSSPGVPSVPGAWEGLAEAEAVGGYRALALARGCSRGFFRSPAGTATPSHAVQAAWESAGSVATAGRGVAVPWESRRRTPRQGLGLRVSPGGPGALGLRGAQMLNATTPEPGAANASSPEPLPLPPALAVAVPVVYAVICAVGLAGNSAVLYVLLRAPRTRSVTNLFILNLAIADELFTLVLPVTIADFLLRRWPFGELMCKLVVAIDQYNVFSSLYFLAVMSADRYLVVLATAQSRQVTGRTYRAARAVSLAVWGLVTLVVLPFVVFARLDAEHGRRQCVLVFPQPEALWWRASRLYTLVLGFALPVSAICVLYATLLCRLRAIRLNSHAKVLDRARRRVTFLVVAILAACLLCWTPYHLSTVVALTTDLPQTPLVVAVSYLITSLSYANSCLNPFLYAFLDDSFRRSLRQLMVCRADA